MTRLVIGYKAWGATDDGSRVLITETSPFEITDNERQRIDRAPGYVVWGVVQ